MVPQYTFSILTETNRDGYRGLSVRIGNVAQIIRNDKKLEKSLHLFCAWVLI